MGYHGVFRPQFGDSAVNRQRNRLTRQFLESDCTHLLFIDSDLVFGVEQIKRIMDHPEPIVGGLYCKKQSGKFPQVVINGLDDATPMREDHMQRVKYIGTGFIRVAREVFERMIEAYDDIWYTCDSEKVKEYDFWSMGVYKFKDGTRRFLTEDWYFCQRALDLGYDIWADMHIVLKHSGSILYPTAEQEKILFNKDKLFKDDFETPTNCLESFHDVFGGQYEFGIDFEQAPRVLDIGANAGAFAWWANWKWPGSRITCYEPNPEIFGILQRNCAKVGANAINSAVGDHDRDTLFVGNDSSLTSGIYRTNRNGNRTIKVTTVDPVDLPEADLIKIDTEGAEPFIVQRMKKLPNYMIVEYHTVENKQRLLEILAGEMAVVGDKAEEPGYGVLAFRKLHI